MATITRCDECRKASDEPGVDYIGKNWEYKSYKRRIAYLRLGKDLCGECVKKLTNETPPSKTEDDED